MSELDEAESDFFQALTELRALMQVCFTLGRLEDKERLVDAASQKLQTMRLAVTFMRDAREDEKI